MPTKKVGRKVGRPKKTTTTRKTRKPRTRTITKTVVVAAPKKRTVHRRRTTRSEEGPKSYGIPEKDLIALMDQDVDNVIRYANLHNVSVRDIRNMIADIKDRFDYRIIKDKSMRQLNDLIEKMGWWQALVPLNVQNTWSNDDLKRVFAKIVNAYIQLGNDPFGNYLDINALARAMTRNVRRKPFDSDKGKSAGLNDEELINTVLTPQGGF